MPLDLVEEKTDEVNSASFRHFGNSRNVEVFFTSHEYETRSLSPKSGVRGYPTRSRSLFGRFPGLPWPPARACGSGNLSGFRSEFRERIPGTQYLILSLERRNRGEGLATGGGQRVH